MRAADVPRGRPPTGALGLVAPDRAWHSSCNRRRVGRFEPRGRPTAHEGLMQGKIVLIIEGGENNRRVDTAVAGVPRAIGPS